MVQQKIKIESLNIGLASPIRIRKWAERILPNGKKIGQVTNSKTVNYKTLKPEIGGLFCEKIFGPIKDFECLCGFKKIKFKTKNKFCPNCDVEFTASQIRRYRLGYIKLASPVTHIWYLRGRPRFLNILFDMAIALNKGKIKDLKPIIYSIDALYLPILKLIKTNLIPFSNNLHKTKIFVSRYQQDSFLISNFASRFYFSHCKTTINSLKNKSTKNSTLQNYFKSEFNQSKFFLSKQNKFSYYKILPNLFEIKKRKLAQRRRPEISFNIIKLKPVEKIYYFLLLEIFETYEYQMVDLFLEKNSKNKTQKKYNNSKILNFYNGFSFLSKKNFQRSLENCQNQSNTNNLYFSKTLKTNFLTYFYNKKILFSQQLSKTFCNSYYLTYSFDSMNLSDKKNRKKKLNKFLKKNLYINLNKTQKTRIFLFNQKIFLNKKKLKIQNKNSQRNFANFQSFAENSLKKSPIFFESLAHFQNFGENSSQSKLSKKNQTRFFLNTFASIKANQNFAPTLYDTENNQSSIKVINQQASKKKFNSTYFDFTQNFQQQNMLELILIINWKLKLLEKKKFQQSLKNKFVNQDFSNLFQEISISNKAIKLKLIFCWLKNEKTLVQFLFSIFTRTNKNKKKCLELTKNKKFSAKLGKSVNFIFSKKNKLSQSELLDTSGLNNRRSFLPLLKESSILSTTKFWQQSKFALPLRNKQNVNQKTQIKYYSYFLTKNILETKTMQKRENTFSKVYETLNKNSFSIQKTKIKLNLFFYYCFNKKKFVNFNGKILCLKKIKKQQIRNLIQQINIKKENFFFNDEKKTFNKTALSTKQTLGHVHRLAFRNSLILENLVNKKKFAYQLSKKNLVRFFLNTSNFDQLKQNRTIFLLYCNFAFKPKISSAAQTSLRIAVKKSPRDFFNQRVCFSKKNKNLQIFEAPLQISILNHLKWGQIKQKKNRTNSWNFINHNLVKSYILFFFKNRETWFTNLLLTNQNRKDFITTNFKTNVTKTDFRLYYKTHFLLSKNLYKYSRFLLLLQKNQNCNKKFSNQRKQNQRYETNLKIFRMIFNSNLCVKKLSKFICNYLIIINNYNTSFTYKNLLCYLRFCSIESSKQTTEPRINHGFNIHGSFENSSHIFFDFSILIHQIESQINSYYPVYSKSILKLSEQKKKKFEFKDLWASFITYITSNSTEQDIKLFFYSNRLEKFNLKKFQLGTQIFDQAFFFSLNQAHGSSSRPAVNKIISDSKKYFVSESKVVSKQLALEQYKYVKRVLTGTEAIFYWLSSLNLEVLKTKLKSKIDYLDTKINQFRDRPFLYDFQKKLLKKIIKIRRKIVKLMKLIYYFKKNKSKPEWLMISILPVLPPNLRPIIQVDANQIAVSDLNQLYKRIIYRNQRIEKYLTKNEQSDSSEIRFHQRLLQESVDALLDNGKGGSPLACSPSGRAFKSLSEILKGKKGRFRQNLLGKRVDYSGRSVIIVGPNLKLHQCGLPKKMAIELFQPFLIRELKNLSGNKIIDRKITIIKAKKLIQKQHPIIWEILEKILKNHPILLNRAPTLHRLGIQAFQPKLIEGKAILLHPLVCSAFNADFDGDQMAVHVPLCFQARAEAWKLMWSRNNLLSPATGEPILTPSQDMILGCYYLTTKKTKSQLINFSFLHKQKNPILLQKLIKNYKQSFNKKKNLNKLNRQNLYFQLKQVLTFCDSSFPLQLNNLNNRTILNKYFNNLNDVLIFFFQENISIHSLVWIKWQNNLETENFNEKPLEIRVDCYGNSIKIYSQYFHNLNHQNQKISQFVLTTVGRILLNKIILENIFFYNSNFSA